jgi:polar amino acid transport system substrate-binding protein
MAMKTFGLSTLLAALLMASSAQAEDVPVQQVNQDVRALVPQAIRDRGYMVAVNTGSYPPYEIIISPTEVEGAAADLAVAMGQIMGVEIRHQTIGGLAPMLAGLDAGRYDMSVGPIGDFPDRRAKIDFIDWVREYVAFAVQKGNPHNIQSLDDVCGLNIAVMAAGSAERVLKKKVGECEAAGKPTTIQSFQDQNGAILAVRSKRADGFFSGQAPLTYFVSQAPSLLDLAATNLPNGFGDIYQGGIAPKDSDLGKAMLMSLDMLVENGTYEQIMKKWGLERNMVEKAGVNLAK